jgi:cardiolipin synthase
VGAALTARRPLGAAEAPTLAVGGGLLVLLGAVAAWRPALLAYPLAAAAAWVGVTLLWSAWRAAHPRPGQDQTG